MNIETNKIYTITGITQKEFDMLYAGVCSLSEREAQNYNEDIQGLEILNLAKELSRDASMPLRTHKEG